MEGKSWYINDLTSEFRRRSTANLVPRACDPWEGNEGSGIICCRKPGILAKIELRIHFNGQSDSSLKRIIPEPSFPSQGSQARGTRLINSLTQGHCEGRPSLGLGTRMDLSFFSFSQDLSFFFPKKDPGYEVGITVVCI